MLRIDMSRIVRKYEKDLRFKTKKGEIPMAPGEWLWHNLDKLDVDKITKCFQHLFFLLARGTSSTCGKSRLFSWVVWKPL